MPRFDGPPSFQAPGVRTRAVMRNDEVLSTLRPGVLVPGEAQPPQGLTDACAWT